MIRVLQVVASINQAVGGPAVTVSRLAASLQAQDVATVIAALDYPEHGSQLNQGGFKLINIRAGWLAKRLRGWCPELRRQMQSIATHGINLVHSHGLWMFPNIYARQVAMSSGLPLIVSPRGMLQQWSLGRGRIKKMIAWNIYEQINLKAAALFHATSEDEALSIKQLGFTQPIAIIPNGIDLPDLASIPDRSMLEKVHPELVDKFWILFLSRLHPVKGIEELLRCWRNLAELYKNWQLIIAGPDLDGYEKYIRQETIRLGLEKRVTFTGMLQGKEKACAFKHADLFILPTHSENFGLVIGEALSHATPVITTKAAPWTDLLTHKCGWWVDRSETDLTSAMLDAMTRPGTARREMGMNGRALMEQSYSWDRISSRMKAVYLWLCNRGERPGCVITE